jgi:ATP-dependent protease ClpP protease subunit
MAEEEQQTSHIERFQNEIYFFDDVTTLTVMRLNILLRQMEREYIGQNTPIILYIHSGGGDLFAGLSSMDHIHNRKVPVHTVADGLCCSAATFIFLGGSKRFVKSHAHMLIHQISSDSEWVKFEDMKDEMKNLERLMNRVLTIYREKTSLPEKKLKRLMKHDMYLSPEQCITYNIADEIFPSFQSSE